MQGFVHPDFWPVSRLLARLTPKHGGGGAAVCIYHRGEKVVDAWSGSRDDNGDPWREDTVSISYSTTKGVTSTLLHILVDRGLVDYDQRVSHYWPEFAEGGKRDITVRQVLCHEAGLYDIRAMIDDARRMLDWEYMTTMLARAQPVHPPGTAHGYHGLTYGWLVGEICQRATDRRFQDLLRTEIAEPLGLDGLFIGMPESELGRRAKLLIPDALRERLDSPRFLAAVRTLNQTLAALRVPVDLRGLRQALLPLGMEDFDFNDDDVARAVIPAANGAFTARSLARMYAALACGGELDGVRLLSSGTLAQATQRQNTGVGRVVPFPMHWRLGYHRAFLPRGPVSGSFGHFGFGGSGAWADPKRKLSVALVLNSGVGTPFGDLRIIQMSGAAVRAADRR